MNNNKSMNILMLGGNIERSEVVKALMKTATKNSKVELRINIILSVSPKELVRLSQDWEDICENIRLFVDLKAIDTIDNFIKTQYCIQGLRGDELYVVTSDYHMRRAIAIGKIFHPKLKLIATPYFDDHQKKETTVQRIIDIAVARFYRATGIRFLDRELRTRMQKRKVQRKDYQNEINNLIFTYYKRLQIIG